MSLARRNLVQDMTRFMLSVIGVALAVMLILILSGFLNGMYRQISAYLDHTSSSIVVAQDGVRNLLGATSLLPSAMDSVVKTRGAARVVPILSQFAILDLHDKKVPVYLVGYEPKIGGEKQRVANAWALVNDPTLILADEPTANLDSRIRHEIMRLLRRIAKEQQRSVVIVSHGQRIKDTADRVLWLEDGQFKKDA